MGRGSSASCYCSLESHSPQPCSSAGTQCVFRELHLRVSREAKHQERSENPSSLFPLLKPYISCILGALPHVSLLCYMYTPGVAQTNLEDVLRFFLGTSFVLTREQMLPLLHPTWIRRAGFAIVGHGRQWWKSSAIWLSPLCIHFPFC